MPNQGIEKIPMVEEMNIAVRRIQILIVIGFEARIIPIAIAFLIIRREIRVIYKNRRRS